MSDRPQVKLDFEKNWCPRHLEHYREEWPRGAGVAMIVLFDAFVSDPRTIDRAPKLEGGAANAQALQPLIDEHSPLCCFLGDERMEKLYEEVEAKLRSIGS